MAKPIKATPVLKEEEAVKFLKEMANKEKSRISYNDLELAETLEKINPLVC